MNREIEFRGFDSREWRYGDLEYNRKDDVARIHTYKEDGSYGKQYLVDPYTVGEFTELLDKYGKKIYEGDIIKHPYVDPIFRDLVEPKEGDGVTSEVVFHDGAFVVKYDENDFIYLDAFTRHGYVEVIGNIYDNPELLDKKE
jgi:uncharacterized phage protein (TIGR01671 family)